MVDCALGPVLQLRIGASLEEVEQRVILATLRQLAGDKKKAAQVLGISLKTLYNRLSACHASWQIDHVENVER